MYLFVSYVEAVEWGTKLAVIIADVSAYEAVAKERNV